jgi:membrane protein DedA with SNARE-associated domain
VEIFLEWFANLDRNYLYASIFVIAYIENLIPPIPSDVLIVFAGYLAGTGTVDVIWAFIIAVVGSTTGFMTMFGIGHALGNRVIERGRLPLIPIQSVHTAERWFRKWGYGLIVLNRFLSGTRAVIAFFAGLSALRFPLTVLLCFVSAALWNGILIYLGWELGENWREIGGMFRQYRYLSTLFITVFLVLTVTYVVLKNIKRSRG